jgi:hypothetical protein
VGPARGGGGPCPAPQEPVPERALLPRARCLLLLDMGRAVPLPQQVVARDGPRSRPAALQAARSPLGRRPGAHGADHHVLAVDWAMSLGPALVLHHLRDALHDRPGPCPLSPW